MSTEVSVTKTVYKIRDKKTGLFRCGGSKGWSKLGKTWSGTGPIKLHLNLLSECKRYDWTLGKYVAMYELAEISADWEIVPFTLIEGADIKSVKDWLLEHPKK
jgi:hypothetical protein